jgi:hypothetical protein
MTFNRELNECCPSSNGLPVVIELLDLHQGLPNTRTKLGLIAYFVNQELNDIGGKIQPFCGGRLILYFLVSNLQ